jgi:hypothetical protein
MESVVPDDRLEEVIGALADAACTGKIGDGKSCLRYAEAIRIRNDERGEGALQRHISRKVYKIFTPSLLLLHVFFLILMA